MCIRDSLWRGHTHWSMAVAGGSCLLILYRIYDKLIHVHIVVKCAIGSLVITSIEFVTGCFVNLKMGWNVWDYSNMPFHYRGQVCLCLLYTSTAAVRLVCILTHLGSLPLLIKRHRHF